MIMRTIFLLLTLLFGMMMHQLSGQNAPISSVGAVVTYETTAVVPLTVTDFTGINICDLKIIYDPSVALPTAVTKDPAVAAWQFISDFSEPGIITIAWLNFAPLTLPPNSVFANIYFDKVTDGYTDIEFDTSQPDNCQWGTYPPAADLNDTPESEYYIDGSVDFMNENSIELDLKVFLEGAFTGSEMTTSLNDFSLMPTSQPYSGSPWNYEGPEAVLTIPVNAVDWVLVELRETTGDASSATPDKVISKQAGFLMKDGSLKNTDGITSLAFPVLVNNNLFIVIYHRNHVAAISADPTLLVNKNGNYDFSSGEFKVLGGNTGHKELSPGLWGLAAGDSNGDGTVDGLDKQTNWGQNAGSSGYLPADFSFDAQVGNKDKNEFWILNFGFSSNVP